MTSTSIAPIGARQINQNLYVGHSDLTTIQKAVDFARQDGGVFVVVIPHDYAGSDTIAGVVNGTASVILSDQRGTNAQNYIWSGTAYTAAAFTQLGRISAPSATFATLDVTETLTAAAATFATLDVTETLTADAAAFDSCSVDGSPVRTYANTPVVGTPYPPAGIGVSTGTAWATSIDPASLAYLAANNVFTGNMTINGTLTGVDAEFHTCEVNGSPVVTVATLPPPPSMVYPGAGVGVSTGTAWGTSIDPATLPRLAANNVFTGDLTANGWKLYAASFFNAAGLGSLRSYVGNIYIDAPTGNICLGRDSGTGAVFFGQNASINAAGAATLTGCNVNGSPVVTVATLPPGSMVYPGAGVGVSTGSAWGTSIDPATLAHMNVANSGNFSLDGTLSGGGFVLYTSGSASPVGGAGSLRRTGTAITLNAPGGGVYLNYDSGVNGVTFGNGAGGSVGSIDGAGNLSVNGAKAFRIPHPLDKSKDLIHACLEGPEVAVYYRGEAKCASGKASVTLPNYFEALTTKDGRTVQLTQVDDGKELALLTASRVSGGKFTIRASVKDAIVYWEVKAIRADASIEVVSPRRKELREGKQEKAA